MKINKVKNFEGIFLIKSKKLKDNRGFFLRGFCKKILKNNRLNFNIKQINFSYNQQKYTLRGFHYQKKPYGENKIIKCVNGSVMLVLLNIDSKSKNYLNHKKIFLSEKDSNFVYISKNYATAFITLKPRTLVVYYMSNYYKVKKSFGIKYNDPKLRIKWPIKPKIISKKDNNFKLL